MSFGSGGFGSGGFGQQNQPGSTGFGGFGSSNPTTTPGFGATGTSAFGSTPAATSGGGLFGSTAGSGSGFGGTGGAFGSTTSGFGATKPGFGTPTTSAGGLFGASTTTAGTSGFGSGGFGTTAASAGTSFGGTSTAPLFGSGAKPAFGATPAAPTSLFGGGSTGFGGGTGTGFGATANPGIGTNIGEPPGTNQTEFRASIEKEANSSTAQNSFQNILFMDPYKKWSSDELRLVDYNQGRRYGNTGGTGAFGVGSGFGTGGFGSAAPTAGFGGGSTGTGMFGSSQPTSGFGQTSTTGAFGSGGGGLFGGTQSKPAPGGMFGTSATSQPAQSGGLFGTSSGGFGSGATTGAGFGQTSTTGGTGLFGGAQASKPAAGFGFGQTAGQTTGGFGSGTTPTGFGGAPAATSTTGGLFGQTQQQPQQTGIFGSGAQTGSTAGFGGTGFGQAQQSGLSPFGQQQQAAKPGGLFGNTSGTTTGSGLFGTSAASPSPFSGTAGTQQTGGLFAPKPVGATGSGLFGQAATTTQSGTSGGIFGQSAQTQQTPQGGSLFGNLSQAAKPSLFGQTQQPATGFGQSQPIAGGGMFGNVSTQQQPQASGFGGSLFANSQGTQQVPQSLTASINDISAYGTPSLFSSLGNNEVQNPGPLATPLGNKGRTSGRSSILPMYKLNPGSATKFVTPQRKGYGFSYSTFGTPSSPSSVASTPGQLGQSLLAGSINRGLSKSISSSSLRRSYAPEDSILAPGAFASSSGGPRFYGNTGSMSKKLIINKELRSDLFTSPSKDKQPQEFANGQRKLNKRVSFDTTNVPAIENGERSSPDASSNSAQDLGYIRPPMQQVNGNTASKGSPAQGATEQEPVKSRDLARVPEENQSSPQATPTASSGPAVQVRTPAAGEYSMSPSREEIQTMNRIQRGAVQDFTVSRENIGSVRWLDTVDLNTVDINDILGGIVVLEPRSATVYPVTAKKPPQGKGLNRPAEISLEKSLPRNGSKDAADSKVQKHIQRLKSIKDTTFVDYRAETGRWTFQVPHFTTYKLYEDDDGDQPTEPQPAASHNTEEVSSSPDVDPDDTFDTEYKRQRRTLPGAFDATELSDDEDVQMQAQESFLSSGSAEYAPNDDAAALVPASDHDMGLEDDVMESVEVATYSQQHLPAESLYDSPFDGRGAPLTQETPAGIMRARMRAIKESATPIKLQVAGGDDWLDMLQQTVSPQKRDRAALKALEEADVANKLKHITREKSGAPGGKRIVSDGRGFATSIDLMNSLFEKAKEPVPQVPQTITPAKGFMKWPYKRQNKSLDEDEANMSDADRAFHASIKPNFAFDGSGLYGANARKFQLSQEPHLIEEDPLIGIPDHRALVEVRLSNGVPTISTQRIPHVKAFSAFRPSALGGQSSLVGSEIKNSTVCEQSVWELASVLFDPVKGSNLPGEHTSLRRKQLAEFWTLLVSGSTSSLVSLAQTLEDRAVCLLAGHKIADACAALAEAKDLKLATLVSLIGSSEQFKKDMHEQVDDWLRSDVFSEFTVPLRVIYTILGANVTACEGKQGVGVENRLSQENIARRYGMDWMQAFGLRLWYGTPADAGIEETVRLFMQDIDDGKVPAPRPWYMPGEPVFGGNHEHEDLLWGLLKVFAGKANLEEVLQPQNVQPSALGFRLCWQLNQAISITNQASLPSNKADALTLSYAAEVVHIGKAGNWINAIWILLHLSDPTARTKATQEVLAHNAGSLCGKQAKLESYYERLTDELKIPAPWIWQAAALHWRAQQSHPWLEAQCLLKAAAFPEAHQIFIQKLAPRAIIEHNYSEISSVLTRIKPYQHSIPEWALGGAVYADFLDMLSHSGQRRGSTTAAGTGSTANQAALVEGLMSSLPRMYEAAGNSDMLQVAAITEMADLVAKEAVALASHGRMDLAKISRLPLTEDRHLRYSSDMAFAYYREVMSARG